jgi:hypothetical protein
MSELDSMETLFVRLADDAPPDGAERIADQVAVLGGLVLMATGRGSLIVALPRDAKDAIAQHTLVSLVGGVTLSNEGKAARALQQQFALNAARQLVDQGRLPKAFADNDDPTAGRIGRLAVRSLSPDAERSRT